MRQSEITKYIYDSLIDASTLDIHFPEEGNAQFNTPYFEVKDNSSHSNGNIGGNKIIGTFAINLNFHAEDGEIWGKEQLEKISDDIDLSLLDIDLPPSIRPIIDKKDGWLILPIIYTYKHETCTP